MKQFVKISQQIVLMFKIKKKLEAAFVAIKMTLHTIGFDGNMEKWSKNQEGRKKNQNQGDKKGEKRERKKEKATKKKKDCK